MCQVIQFPVTPKKPADRHEPEQFDRCFHCATRLICLGSGDLTFTCRRCYETLRDAGKLGELKRPVSKLEQTYVCPKCAARTVARTLWVDAEIDCRCGTRMEAK